MAINPDQNDLEDDGCSLNALLKQTDFSATHIDAGASVAPNSNLDYGFAYTVEHLRATSHRDLVAHAWTAQLGEVSSIMR